ncbi:HAMP domain-containing histidine kinase, partial [Mesorhizobium sp. M00.F.Ca.ET.186.01.1.1]
QEAEEKGLQLVVEVEAELPRIYADKDRVAQILKNLVKNALKFTNTGEIRMTAGLQEQWMRIQVQDTGMGIAADDLDRIWERFFKVDRGRS